MQSKIDALWDWFKDNEHKILDCFSEDHSVHQEFVVDGLNELILEIGMFTWEIGQNDSGMFIIISPNRDAELLKLSRKIVSGAPEMSSWKFHYARPAINWNREFIVHNELMDECKVDASDWSFKAKKLSDGLHISFYAPTTTLDQETAKSAAETVIINELGEAFRIQNVSSVSVISSQSLDNPESIDALHKLRT